MLALLLACADPVDTSDKILASDSGDTAEDTGDTNVVPEDLGDPYLAMVAPVPPGFLSADCVMRVELYSGDESLAILEINPAVGGEWAGMDLEGGVQYRVVAYHSQCTEQTPEETTESGTFSGVAGLLFVYRFNGSNSGVESLEQTIDFSGGTAYITLAPGTASEQLVADAAALGASITLGAEPDTYVATFPTDLPVGKVLSELAKVEGFVEGSPDWISQPGWW